MFPTYTLGVSSDGSVFKRSIVCKSAKESKCSQFYSEKRSDGFHICPYGLTVYQWNSKIECAGIKVSGKFDKKKLLGKCDLQPISESLVTQGVFDSIRSEKIKEALEYLIHDIRNWNKEIINKAEELRTIPNIEQRDDVERIFRSSEMIKTCLDGVSIELNPSANGMSTQNVPFKKFEKAVKCLSHKSSVKQVKIDLVGNAHKSFNSFHNFDLAVYFLMENIIKYAPQNTTATISFIENHDGTTVDVKTIGPHILEEEIPYIFHKNFRGKFAKQSMIAGSGIGLYRYKKIMDQNRCTTQIKSQRLTHARYGQNMADISMTIHIPLK
jgi:hypothetical protein